MSRCAWTSAPARVPSGSPVQADGQAHQEDLNYSPEGAGHITGIS